MWAVTPKPTAMLSTFKNVLLGLVAVVGFTTSSCEKMSPNAEQPAVTSRLNSQEELVDKMTADPLVREFILDNERFLTTYDVWYKGLSVEQQAAHRAAIKQASESRQLLPDAFRSPAEVRAHQAAQGKLALGIKAKYPAFFALSPEARGKAEGQLYEQILAQAGVPDDLANMCHAGYSACSFYGYTNGDGQQTQDACYAGYRGCMGYSEEAN